MKSKITAKLEIYNMPTNENINKYVVARFIRGDLFYIKSFDTIKSAKEYVLANQHNDFLDGEVDLFIIEFLYCDKDMKFKEDFIELMVEDELHEPKCSSCGRRHIFFERIYFHKLNKKFYCCECAEEHYKKTHEK